MVQQIRYILLTVAAVMSGGAGAEAQRPNNAPAASLLAQAKAALNTSGQASTDVHLTGTVTFITGKQEESGSIHFLTRPDGTEKTELLLPSGRRGEVRFPLGDSRESAELSPDATRKLMPQRNLTGEGNWFFPEHLVNRLLRNGRSNTTTTAACPPELICISSSDQSAADDTYGTMTLLLEPDSFRPVGAMFYVHPGNNPHLKVLMQVKYSEYRSIDGHDIPFHLQQYVNGTLHLDIKLSQTDLTTPSSDSDLTLR